MATCADSSEKKKWRCKEPQVNVCIAIRSSSGEKLWPLLLSRSWRRGKSLLCWLLVRKPNWKASCTFTISGRSRYSENLAACQPEDGLTARLGTTRGKIPLGHPPAPPSKGE